MYSGVCLDRLEDKKQKLCQDESSDRELCMTLNGTSWQQLAVSFCAVQEKTK